jgi:hypothetical protein
VSTLDALERAAHHTRLLNGGRLELDEQLGEGEPHFAKQR